MRRATIQPNFNEIQYEIPTDIHSNLNQKISLNFYLKIYRN